MNCVYHPDQSAVAYCRTCGKALCANCTRPVRGVIYCEDCLGQRMEGQRMEGARPPAGAPAAGFVPPPAAGFVSPPPGAVPVAPMPPFAGSSGPNPTVAGILSGFFPFGVGAVYTGQYAKGLAHLAIFAMLIAGICTGDRSNSDALVVICALGISFFYVYQIVDSVRTARALQVGLPPPDPYGLAATFGAGTRVEPSKAPIGAIVLIILGVLFLLSTMGLEIGLDRFWPLILIGVGAWIFLRNAGIVGSDARARNLAKIEGFAADHGSATMQQFIAIARCQCARCRARRLMGPAVLVTVGFLFLFETLGKVSFGHSWPIILLVIGGIKLYQGTASTEGHITPAPPGPPAPPANFAPPSPPPPQPPPPPAAPGEVSHG